MSSLFSDFKKELNNYSYKDLINNLINHSNNKKLEEKEKDNENVEKCNYNKSLDLLLDQEYTTVDENKINMMKTLFENNLNNLDKDKEHRSNQKIINSLLKRINYITFFSFIFMIFHIRKSSF